MADQRLGNYRLLRRLATGGMGEVFLAEQEGPGDLRQRVVVKRLLRHLASDPAFIDMFLEEARIAAMIHHPNVAETLEFGEDNGTFFLALEYVRGRSLRDLLKTLRHHDERIPTRVAVAIVIGVLRGLHAAHTLVDENGVLRGCVHRDVSAENVLLSLEGEVKLVDFGIAKALSATTVRGTMLRGKYGYMAPEQYHRAKVDARTDVFSCGVLLFELLTGERPFVAGSEAGIMHAIMNDEPPSLSPVIGGAGELDAIVHRALAKEPDGRFATAEDMARELEAFLAPAAAGTAAALREFARSWLDEETPTHERVIDEATPRGTAPVDVFGPTARIAAGAPVDRKRRRWVASLAVVVVGGVIVTASMGGARKSSPPVETPASAAPSMESSAEPTPSGSDSATTVQALDAPDRRAGEPARHAMDKSTRRGPPSVEKIAGVGTLAFRIRPWAEIFVDGRSIGISPVSPVELPAGRHTVVLRNKSLGKERSMTTHIVRGETTTLRVDLME